MQQPFQVVAAVTIANPLAKPISDAISVLQLATAYGHFLQSARMSSDTFAAIKSTRQYQAVNDFPVQVEIDDSVEASAVMFTIEGGDVVAVLNVGPLPEPVTA